MIRNSNKFTSLKNQYFNVELQSDTNHMFEMSLQTNS